MEDSSAIMGGIWRGEQENTKEARKGLHRETMTKTKSEQPRAGEARQKWRKGLR